MQDDFDNRMGLPDDELPGGSAMSDMGDSADRAETDMDLGGEPAELPDLDVIARTNFRYRSHVILLTNDIDSFIPWHNLTSASKMSHNPSLLSA